MLAIAASLLGFAPVVACDHELPSIEAAAANAELNGASVEVGRLNLREQPGPAADLWLANLTAPLLGAVAGLMPAPGAGGPRDLIVSGLLVRERAEVEEAFGGARLPAARLPRARRLGRAAARRLISGSRRAAVTIAP